MKYIVTFLVLGLVAVGVYMNLDAVGSFFMGSRGVELVDEKITGGYMLTKDLEGKDHELGELRGKTTVMIVWSVRCDDCSDFMERMQALSDEYTPKGVR